MFGFGVVVVVVVPRGVVVVTAVAAAAAAAAARSRRILRNLCSNTDTGVLVVIKFNVVELILRDSEIVPNGPCSLGVR